MPLPRYNPVRTRIDKPPPKPKASINDLDDYCLSKVIGYVLLSTSSPRDADELIARDNVKIEKNLSLVSKRWYFMTQSQVASFGVCRIDLDRIIKGRSLYDPPRVVQTISKTPFTPRTPRVLSQRNEIQTRAAYGTPAIKRFRTANGGGAPVAEVTPILSSLVSYNIGLHLKIRSLIFKYKHLIIEGTIKCDEFYKLLIDLNSAKVEKLHLNLKIERDGTLSKNFAVMPREFTNLKNLTLTWTDNLDYMFGNLITWTIFMRASSLTCLQIILREEDEKTISSIDNNNDDNDKIISVEKVARQFLSKIQESRHLNLRKVVFYRGASNSNEPNSLSDCNCRYSPLLKDIFAIERNLSQVETNDNSLIEHLIKSSDRICTSNQIRYLKISSIINSNFLLKLLTSNNLGSHYLSVMIDNVNQLEEVRHAMTCFKQIRQPQAICQICLHLKDQKFSDCEDKIKNLIHLSKLSELIVYISALQRVTIDCCHLMWSVGRALQASSNAPGLVTSSSSSSINSEFGSSSSNSTASCIFKVLLQPSVRSATSGPNNCSEITIPFGRFHNYKINSSREDLLRHREILKALRKDCYHQFVKSIREKVIA